MTVLDRIEAVPISMRHPAWRWNAALMVVADPNNNVDTAAALATTDTYVSRAIRFCRDKQDPRMQGPKANWTNHPDVYEAYLISMCANPNGGYKWQIEAMLMTGVSYEQIAENYAFRGGADTIRTYGKLFFDVEPYRDKELVVLANVLSSSLAANMGIDDFDYSWKAFAYDRGYDNLLKFLRFRAGSRLPKTLKKWFDEMTQDRVAYGAYSASASLRNMFNQQAIQVLDVAKNYYSTTHAILQNSPNDDNDVSLAAKEILGSLQEVILNPNIERKVAENTDSHEPIIFSNPPVSN